MKRRVFIVDLCGTLVFDNTTHAFLRSLDVKPLRSLMRSVALGRMGAILNKLAGRDVARKLAIWSLEGLERTYLKEAADAYTTKALKDRIRPEIISIVQGFQSRGEQVFLATASLEPIAVAMVRELNLDGYVSSKLAFDSKSLCRGVLESDSTGKKLVLLEAKYPWLQMADWTVATDNREDIDLKERANLVYQIVGGQIIVEARAQCGNQK